MSVVDLGPGSGGDRPPFPGDRIGDDCVAAAEKAGLVVAGADAQGSGTGRTGGGLVGEEVRPQAERRGGARCLDRLHRPAGPRAHPARRTDRGGRDNSNTRRTAGVQKYAAEHDWLGVFQLSSYASDLNPVEGVRYFFGAARRPTPPPGTGATSPERCTEASDPCDPGTHSSTSAWPGPD